MLELTPEEKKYLQRYKKMVNELKAYKYLKQFNKRQAAEIYGKDLAKLGLTGYTINLKEALKSQLGIKKDSELRDYFRNNWDANQSRFGRRTLYKLKQENADEAVDKLLENSEIPMYMVSSNLGSHAYADSNEGFWHRLWRGLTFNDIVDPKYLENRYIAIDPNNARLNKEKVKYYEKPATNSGKRKEKFIDDVEKFNLLLPQDRKFVSGKTPQMLLPLKTLIEHEGNAHANAFLLNGWQDAFNPWSDNYYDFSDDEKWVGMSAAKRALIKKLGVKATIEQQRQQLLDSLKKPGNRELANDDIDRWRNYYEGLGSDRSKKRFLEDTLSTI